MCPPCLPVTRLGILAIQVKFPYAFSCPPMTLGGILLFESVFPSFCLFLHAYGSGRDFAVLTTYFRLLQIISGQHCSFSEIICILHAIRQRRVYCLIDGYCAF